MLWTDGGALQYENWADGEPNGADDREDCGEMWNDQWPAKWNDHRCSDYKRYVCKAPKSKLPYSALFFSVSECKYKTCNSNNFDVIDNIPTYM